MSTTAKKAYGFWDSLFQDKITKRVVEVASVFAAIWLIYELTNKLFDHWADKEFNKLRLKLFPKAKDPKTGKDNPDDKRIGTQTNPTAPNFTPPPSVSQSPGVADNRMTLPTSGDGSYNDIASKIGDGIHLIGASDVDNMLSELEVANTKTDLALIIAAYNDFAKTKFWSQDKKDLMTVLNSELSSENKKAMQAWINGLPDYQSQVK